MADYKRKMRVLFVSSANDFGAQTGGAGTFQALIKQVLATTPIPRGFIFGDKSIYLLHEDDKPEGVYLHLVVYKSGGAVTAINDPGNGHPGQLDAVPPPTNKQFIASTLLYLVRGNDVVACRSGTNTDAPFVSWAWQASAAAGILPAEYLFELKHRANVNKLAAIQTEGIKSLTFNGAASLGALNQASRTTARDSVVGAVVDQVKSMFGAGMGPSLADNTKVEVKFTVDQRSAALAHDPLVLATATQALQDNTDGFQIVTATNKRFTAEDVLLSRDAKMTPLGLHPDHVNAWSELKKYQDDL
jgi:hypothetical protein